MKTLKALTILAVLVVSSNLLLAANPHTPSLIVGVADPNHTNPLSDRLVTFNAQIVEITPKPEFEQGGVSLNGEDRMLRAVDRGDNDGGKAIIATMAYDVEYQIRMMGFPEDASNPKRNVVSAKITIPSPTITPPTNDARLLKAANDFFASMAVFHELNAGFDSFIRIFDATQTVTPTPDP